MYFNQASRKVNAAKTSFAGTTASVFKVLLGFGYRTLFLHYLSASYLGINGLFSSILQVLGMAELGVTTAIVYRFYEPISKDDVKKVSQLMWFFKRIYTIIALIIFGIGLAVMPFIKFLIKSESEIPADINIYLVYFLFLLNSVSSYIFAYKLTLLTVDQKNYEYSIIDIITTVFKYAAQILILIFTKDYTWSLGVGIAATILMNYIGSAYVTGKYKEVFKIKEKLSKAEQKNIFNDTKACMCHKVGSVVVNATDNAVLTKMVSLIATGLYSNYSLIISNVQTVLTQLLGNFASSVGNAKNMITIDNYYALYKKMKFLNLWIASLSTICLYCLVDDFISVWLGRDFIFDKLTTIVLTIQFFMTVTRIIDGSFINAGGWFVRDKIRPLIEAVLNVVISIVLTRYLGISGVFIGTIVSSGATAFWRETYILYKYDFKIPYREYWKLYLPFTVITCAACGLAEAAKLLIERNFGWLFIIAEAIIVFLVTNGILVLMFRKKEEYDYMCEFGKKIIRKVLKKNG